MPKAELPLWQRLERALVKIARELGYTLDEDERNGNKIGYFPPNTTDKDYFDITELAKDLEKELER